MRKVWIEAALNGAWSRKFQPGIPDTVEAKCKRNLSNSSTARLFPARPSPDIDNIGGSIR
jgi:hypothetical protein